LRFVVDVVLAEVVVAEVELVVAEPVVAEPVVVTVAPPKVVVVLVALVVVVVDAAVADAPVVVVVADAPVVVVVADAPVVVVVDVAVAGGGDEETLADGVAVVLTFAEGDAEIDSEGVGVPTDADGVVVHVAPPRVGVRELVALCDGVIVGVRV